MRTLSFFTGMGSLLLALNAGMWIQASNTMLPGIWYFLGGVVLSAASSAFASLEDKV